MVTAAARHILTRTEEECGKLKGLIEQGADFAEVARKHSLCPSGKKGGALGEFPRGMMVKEFDEVVFEKKLGAIHGPVKTQFGYHLIEITRRG
ncbi:MAG: peptidylprolyl isomerase [Endomicrobiales bacterium]